MENSSGNRDIHTEGGDYREINNEGIYFEKITKSDAYTEELIESSISSINELILKFEKVNGKKSNIENMKTATNVVEAIENDLNLKDKIMKIISLGSISALSTAINHPAASFILTAIQEFRNQNNKKISDKREY